MKIKIAIVDDHPMLLRGVQGVLSCADHIEVIGTFLNGEELLNGIADQQPDILLLDIQMPNQTGDELALILRQTYPDIKILAFTNQEQTYHIRSMMENGVMGYVLKTCDEETLLTAINMIYKGKRYFDPAINDKMLQLTASRHQVKLTRREKEILHLIAQNYSSKEIADQLYIGKRTVDNYRMTLLLKLDVKNSAGLVKAAMDLGIIK